MLRCYKATPPAQAILAAQDLALALGTVNK